MLEWEGGNRALTKRGRRREYVLPGPFLIIEGSEDKR